MTPFSAIFVPQELREAISDRAWLQSTKDSAFKVEARPVRGDPVAVSSRHAVIEYQFGDADKGRPLGNPAAWHLHYHTPERIVEVTVPFEFKNILLP